MSDAALPEGRAADTPPERRGVARDRVRLLVADSTGIRHDVFSRLGEHLHPGDVVVVNTSATRAGAIDGRWRGRPIVLHLSNRLDDGSWVVEIRRSDGLGPVREVVAGEVISLVGGAQAVLMSPYLGSRLWRATVRPSTGRLPGARPITYGGASPTWPLSDYQTIFARPDHATGASAEMPSAGRPFSHRVVTDLVRREIAVVPLTLHAGVSSLERHEPPPPERFRVPASTVKFVEAARARGGRVVAIGTTVTRALETVADPEGNISPGEGWTDLVLGPEHPARVVTGLVTGWHPPDASHLLLLEAVAGSALVERAYRAAFEEGYLWHEFGDSSLLLP